MRKKLHLILSALIALLSGCKNQKEIPISNDEIMVLYGAPTYFQEQEQPIITPHPQDTIEENSSNSSQESVH